MLRRRGLVREALAVEAGHRVLDVVRRMLRAWDRHLAHPALPRPLAAALRAPGFREIRAEAHAFATTELDPETYGGMALRMVEQYIVGLDDIDREEAKPWAEEQRALGARGEYFSAVTQFRFTATRAG